MINIRKGFLGKTYIVWKWGRQHYSIENMWCSHSKYVASDQFVYLVKIAEGILMRQKRPQIIYPTYLNWNFAKLMQKVSKCCITVLIKFYNCFYKFNCSLFIHKRCMWWLYLIQYPIFMEYNIIMGNFFLIWLYIYFIGVYTF